MAVSLIQQPQTTTSWHLASLVLYTSANTLDRVVDSLNVPGLELHATDPRGKLVITLEADNLSELMERIDKLRGLPNVLSAQLVYQQCDDDGSQTNDIDP